MTRQIAFTQASINRAVKAARRAGLTVTGIRADGTVIVRDGEVVLAFQNNLDDSPPPPSKWGDVQA